MTSAVDTVAGRQGAVLGPSSPLNLRTNHRTATDDARRPVPRTSIRPTSKPSEQKTGVGCRLICSSESGVVGMLTDHQQSTEFLPLLSRGRHRRPRNGACVMEYASYLSGEKWSDHPACTHPLLGELARQVNDFISDEGRQALLELVPDLIGLTGSDLHVDLRITLRAARAALPVAAEERQRVMAVAVLISERLLANLDGCPGAPLSRESSDALALAPTAATWAVRYTGNLSISERAFRRQTAPTVVRYAVQGIAYASICDADSRLYDLLAGAIEDCSGPGTPKRTRRRGRDDQAITTSSPIAAMSSGLVTASTSA